MKLFITALFTLLGIALVVVILMVIINALRLLAKKFIESELSEDNEYPDLKIDD